METSGRAQTALVLASSVTVGGIQTCMYYFEGGVYCAQSYQFCSYYLRVLPNKRNTVYISPNPKPRSCICVVKTLSDMINDDYSGEPVKAIPISVIPRI